MAPVINMVMMPVLLLSGILLPMTLGPEWLQKVANVMPTKHVVDAVRNSFLGDFTVSALGWGVAWTFILLAVSLWWGTATFRRENA
jgi:ABC-2 type transport system permease protein